LAASAGAEQSKASSMPGDNGFWFSDDQDVAPSRPKTAKEKPKDSILDSERRARMFSLEHAHLLTEGKDLEAKVVAGTAESANEIMGRDL